MGFKKEEIYPIYFRGDFISTISIKNIPQTKFNQNTTRIINKRIQEEKKRRRRKWKRRRRGFFD